MLPEILKRSRKHTLSVVTIRAFIAVVPLLSSCASTGFYYMSDDWCARHSDASAARCPENRGHAHETAAASRPSTEAPQQ